ncbi:hypothetical protein D3C80_2145670 [compost metagenome]
MIVLKDDVVRTTAGEIGVIIKTWGTYEAFVQIKRQEDGKQLPMFARDVAEIIRRSRKKA